MNHRQRAQNLQNLMKTQKFDMDEFVKFYFSCTYHEVLLIVFYLRFLFA